MRKNSGFTLLEILIALFIFTIVSMMLMSALHRVIGMHRHTEVKAERLRHLQMALLILSRDVEQTVNRPITNMQGQKEAAFLGSARGFALTHTGSKLQHVVYVWKENALLRMTWEDLDQLPESEPNARRLLENISLASFSYLDKKGKWHSSWPIAEDRKQVLPHAVRMTITISNWGNLSQLYVISAE